MSKRQPKKPKERADGTHHVCTCECGGEVRGVEGFGRIWSWCERCSPVKIIKLPLKPIQERP